MNTAQHQEKFFQLRKQFLFFCFESFEYAIEKGALKAEFVFNLADKYTFKPTLLIPERSFYNWNSLSKQTLDTLVFHIGMVELISYWKVACPPKVIIKPFHLGKRAISWWKKLYFNGLGEFFYLNDIRITLQEFMSIKSFSPINVKRPRAHFDKSVLIPIGGGKDSVVNLELLKNERDRKIIPLIMNPREASLKCAETAGFSEGEIAVINRTIDPLLLKLNAEGFLNGHTPFSALLAFVSLLIAFGSGSKYIALSNESSANEATVPGSEINHQYSKSIEFESDFRNYVAANLNKNVQYFSFLRPLNELQIADLFSRYKAYFSVFKSCNVGSKTDSWCGSCPKCLFTWLILSPFISQQELTKIFNKNLLADTKLTPVFDALSGQTETKPFECVGTIDEVNTCASFILKNYDKAEVPVLKNFDATHVIPIATILEEKNGTHFLPEYFERIIKKSRNA
ncbi:MAG: hypothetical protein LBM67_03065 [Lentimicrobiaceae bacterium]|nr:hypothetical protein [Lentimicrobiaceae bacterium]